MRIAIMLAVVISTVNLVSAEIPWTQDLRAAHQLAQSQGKLLLVHFESDNCVWCDRLEAGAFQSADVASTIAQAYVPVKINASKNQRLAEYFKVNRFPTDVVVDSSGAVHSHIISPQKPGDYIAMLQQASAKSGRALNVPGAGLVQNAAAAGTQGLAQAQAGVAGAYNSVAQGIAGVTPLVADNGFKLPGAAPAANPGSQFQLPAQTANGPTAGQTVSAGGHNAFGIPSIQANNGPTGGTGVNNFAMPTDVAVGVNAPPVPEAVTTPEKPEPSALPELAMEGFCAVAILDEATWKEGDDRYGAIHLGKLYLFASAENQSRFLSDPGKYTPALGGMDVVKFIDGNEEVEGVREYGVSHNGRLFFFASEDSLKMFFQSPEDYSVPAQEIMRQATSRALDTKLR